MVFEIGTKTDQLSRLECIRQLKEYLLAVSDKRFDELLLGVAQVGNEVYLLKNARNTTKFARAVANETWITWISMFDPRYVALLNEIRDLGYLNDHDLSQRINV